MRHIEWGDSCHSHRWRVCPSVCLSVTRWYWLKTSNRRIMGFTVE